MNRLARVAAWATACALAAPFAVPALAQIITANVAFPKEATSTAINGTIKGDQTRDYVVRAAAGQVMSVRLNGAPIVYFNVLAPGSNDAAIHTGSMDGNTFNGTLSASGAYKIRVYQMRASARRGETGSYRLAISVTGSGANAGASGSRQGSIAGIQGMDGIRAFDELRARGFANVDSFSSGNTLYGVYYYRPARLCVQTTAADNWIVDIRDIKTHPKCR